MEMDSEEKVKLFSLRGWESIPSILHLKKQKAKNKDEILRCKKALLRMTAFFCHP